MPANIKPNPTKICMDIFSFKKKQPNKIEVTKDKGIIIETDTPKGYLFKIINDIINAVI